MDKTQCELKRDLRYHEGYLKGLREAFKIFEKVIKERGEKVLDSEEGKAYDDRHARESNGLDI